MFIQVFVQGKQQPNNELDQQNINKIKQYNDINTRKIFILLSNNEIYVRDSSTRQLDLFNLFDQTSQFNPFDQVGAFNPFDETD